MVVVVGFDFVGLLCCVLCAMCVLLALLVFRLTFSSYTSHIYICFVSHVTSSHALECSMVDGYYAICAMCYVLYNTIILYIYK